MKVKENSLTRDPGRPNQSIHYNIKIKFWSTNLFSKNEFPLYTFKADTSKVCRLAGLVRIFLTRVKKLCLLPFLCKRLRGRRRSYLQLIL